MNFKQYMLCLSLFLTGFIPFILVGDNLSNNIQYYDQEQYCPGNNIYDLDLKLQKFKMQEKLYQLETILFLIQSDYYMLGIENMDILQYLQYFDYNIPKEIYERSV